jgi:hypothetical protein
MTCFTPLSEERLAYDGPSLAGCGGIAASLTHSFCCPSLRHCVHAPKMPSVTRHEPFFRTFIVGVWARRRWPFCRHSRKTFFCPNGAPSPRCIRQGQRPLSTSEAKQEDNFRPTCENLSWPTSRRVMVLGLYFTGNSSANPTSPHYYLHQNNG